VGEDVAPALEQIAGSAGPACSTRIAIRENASKVSQVPKVLTA